jgi:transcriptional regulator with XRE-family HTH domain
MTLAERFGANLVHCRKRTGLSQEEVGIRAELHRTAVGQLERAERAPRVETLIKLAAALEIDPSELLAGIKWQPGEFRPGRFQ